MHGTTIKKLRIACSYLYYTSPKNRGQNKQILKNQSKFQHWVLCHMVIILCDQYRLSFPVDIPIGWEADYAFDGNILRLKFYTPNIKRVLEMVSFGSKTRVTL
jgi:hypothetical protein